MLLAPYINGHKMNDIEFISNRAYLSEKSNSCPRSAIKEMPQWYKDADLYMLNDDGSIKQRTDIGGKSMTWKSCPALLDVMSSGYVIKTPCDIEFYITDRPMVRIEDQKFSDFVHLRNPLEQFITPMGYDDYHFAWWMDWGVLVPEGYSVLYTQPMNRFDLPFISTSGIIDNDKVSLPGALPFFIFKGWEGVIPAGTPYIQLIPFKREDWTSTITTQTEEQISNKMNEYVEKYRVQDGGIYKKEIWQKKRYK